MMLQCNTPIHPIIHDGTQQSERLLAALIPSNLKLDDNSIADTIAFAGKLAERIRFWDENNQTSDEINWQCFWESDTTALLAMIAATDLELLRTSYRSMELEYLRLKSREDKGLKQENGKDAKTALESLIIDPNFGIYGLAKKILAICQKAPSDHPIKITIERVIKTQLQAPLKELIQYHKAIEKDSYTKYKEFIGINGCAAPWGLAKDYDFKCIDYVFPYDQHESLWKLYLKFYQSLKLILNQTQKALKTALRVRSNHQPHIALFIAFLHLFRYLQEDMNGLVEKHLIYYYQDVLRLQTRRLIPDKVHVVFKIAEDLERYRIEKGTLLVGGADSEGVPRLYALEEELVVSQAKLVERINYYYKVTFDETDNREQIFSVVLRGADKYDGLEEEYPTKRKAWSLLSGEPVFQRIKFQKEKLELLAIAFRENGNILPIELEEQIQNIDSQIEALQPNEGFKIITPELALDRNFHRGILLDFQDINSAKELLENFKAQISFQEGLLDIKYIDKPVKLIGANQQERFDGLFNQTSQLLSEENTAFIFPINGEESKAFIYFNVYAPSISFSNINEPPFLRFTKEGFTAQTEISQFSSLRISSASTSKSFVEIPDGAAVVALTSFKNILPQANSTNRTIIQIDSDGTLRQSEELFFFTETKSQNAYLKVPELFQKGIETGIVETGVKSVTGSIIQGGNQLDFIPNNPSDTDNGWIKLNIPAVDSEDERDKFLFNKDQVQLDYYSIGREILLGINAAKKDSILKYNAVGEWANFDGKSKLFDELKLLQPVIQRPLSTSLIEPIKEVQANGNAFLGFEDLQPNQTLSLLFKMAEGTGNPDHFAPDILWSYLKNNRWVQFPPQYILKDETLGLKQTGIIKFQMPSYINNENTRIVGKQGRTDLYWLRVSANEDTTKNIYVDALPMLEDIHVHAVTASFQNNDNDLKHIESGLIPTTISDLRFRDVNVDSVEQPYHSFDGRLPEGINRMAYYKRIHERLRHKNRAVSIWDYERLVLETFPKVAIAKGLSHSERLSMAMPGYVTILAMPFPTQMIGNNIYYPTLNAGSLEQITNYIASKANYFVSGYGDPAFCCSEDTCSCSFKNRIRVINPRYEPIRLKICVRFNQGLDIPYYTKELNDALKDFLAPWAKDEMQPILFGTSMHTTQLLQFLENLEYVDVIVGLAVKHFTKQADADKNEIDLAWSTTEAIQPYTSASILTTYLDRLNEDNPNVIDHEINVITEHDDCTCAQCVKDLEKTKSVAKRDVTIRKKEEQKGTKSIRNQTSPLVKKKKQKSVSKIKIEKTRESTALESIDVSGIIEEVPPNISIKNRLNEVKEKAIEKWSLTGRTKDAIDLIEDELDKLLENKLIIGEVPVDIHSSELGDNAYQIIKGEKRGRFISNLEVKVNVNGVKPTILNVTIKNPKIVS